MQTVLIDTEVQIQLFDTEVQIKEKIDTLLLKNNDESIFICNMLYKTTEWVMRDRLLEIVNEVHNSIKLVVLEN